MKAGRILENLDPEVDPCDNFYDFACGGYIKKTFIPETTSTVSRFDEVTDQGDIILKGNYILKYYVHV